MSLLWHAMIIKRKDLNARPAANVFDESGYLSLKSYQYYAIQNLTINVPMEEVNRGLIPHDEIFTSNFK